MKQGEMTTIQAPFSTSPLPYPQPLSGERKLKIPLARGTKGVNPIRFVVLFGSVAKGIMKDSSDVDFAVLQEHNIPLTYDDRHLLYNLVESLYPTGARTIDLVDLATANPLLRYEVTKGGKLLYGDDLDYAHYKIFAFKDYIDSQSLFVLEKKLITKRQKFLASVIAQTV